MSWNPAQYLQYEDARLRPALDLLARVPLDAAAAVVDLGCGAGNVARHLARRWPAARIEGVDGDAGMLERARVATSGDGRFSWTQCDLAAWRPRDRVDVLYSNAALHWLDDHARLFPRLFAAVAPGGAMAVQMPDNFRAPSHEALFDTASLPRWRERLAPQVRRAPVAAIAHYHAWLEPLAESMDLWATEYLQRLPMREDGEHPVVAWMRGTALVPFLEALVEEERHAFVGEFAARIEGAYPRRRDGSVLFPFRRIFIVAMRGDAAGD
jgi:trans-aconitate 2-methyltransferase